MKTCDACEQPAERLRKNRHNHLLCNNCVCQHCGSPNLSNSQLFIDWLKCEHCGALHFQIKENHWQLELVEELMIYDEHSDEWFPSEEGATEKRAVANDMIYDQVRDAEVGL